MERYPKSAYLMALIPELQRITLRIEPNRIQDVAPLFFGISLANRKGLTINSQLGQDAYALGILENRKGSKFYLEIGAYHPRIYSNTALLRDYGGWSGLSVDPNPHTARSFLDAGLKDSFYEIAVGSTEGVVSLLEKGALSEIKSESDNRQIYHEVKMITPKLLLEDLPPIDYLSLDIEGGELDVLNNWPWESSKPSLITVEHNFRTQEMKEIQKLLHANGYKCFLEDITEFENWYVLQDVVY